MDKTIEVIVVAMIALVTGLIVLYLVQGQSGSFGGFLDSQSGNAKCGIWKTQYENQNCQNSDLEKKLRNKCGSVSSLCQSDSSPSSPGGTQ